VQTVPRYSNWEIRILISASTAAASSAANRVHQTTAVIRAPNTAPPGLARRCQAITMTTRETAAAAAWAVA